MRSLPSIRVPDRPTAPGGLVRVLCVLALGCWAARPTVAEESLEVVVTRDGPLLRVHATLGADAPTRLCYAVLADFDHLEQFVPGLLASDVISAPGEPIRLHQVGKASAGPLRFAIDVTLAVTEHPPTRIQFRRIDGNLEEMTGGWDVTGGESRCDIAYRADIDPAFWVPPLVGPRLMRNQVETQMRGVLDEIARRASEPAATDAGRP
jgi:ribosome-associated toxin RatA of RatAB toxin-antitoxin module